MHITKQDYCKTPRRKHSHRGMFWGCECGKVYQLKQVESPEGRGFIREWQWVQIEFRNKDDKF